MNWDNIASGLFVILTITWLISGFILLVGINWILGLAVFIIPPIIFIVVLYLIPEKKGEDSKLQFRPSQSADSEAISGVSAHIEEDDDDGNGDENDSCCGRSQGPYYH